MKQKTSSNGEIKESAGRNHAMSRVKYRIVIDFYSEMYVKVAKRQALKGDTALAEKSSQSQN